MGDKKGEPFGVRLKRLIGSMSPRHLARELDISESTVYTWLADDIKVPRGEHVAALAQMFGVTSDYLLGIEPAPDEPEPDPDLPEGAEPVGEMVLIPLYARVTAGEGGVIDTEIVEYHHLPRRFLPESELDTCGLIEARGDSMTGAAGIEDGDWVLLCHGVEPQDGQIAVVDIDGEATVKRIYRTPDGIILQADNPAVPPRVISGPALEHTRVLGRVMRVIRQM